MVTKIVTKLMGQMTSLYIYNFNLVSTLLNAMIPYHLGVSESMMSSQPAHKTNLMMTRFTLTSVEEWQWQWIVVNVCAGHENRMINMSESSVL